MTHELQPQLVTKSHAVLPGLLEGSITLKSDGSLRRRTVVTGDSAVLSGSTPGSTFEW